LSGGNFHGEYITHIADSLCAINSKIAYTLERQMTYMLNPFRNKNTLPTYLMTDVKKAGLYSGYMLTQYTANALTQKIAQKALPVAMFNITSANESEDVVSYGATAALNLLDQLELLHQLTTIYLTVCSQAYSIKRQEGINVSPDLTSEKVFASVSKYAEVSPYPSHYDESFEERYKNSSRLLVSNELGKIIDFPFTKIWCKNTQNLKHQFI
jgi:histidine ammonia-lyase